MREFVRLLRAFGEGDDRNGFLCLYFYMRMAIDRLIVVFPKETYC